MTGKILRDCLVYLLFVLAFGGFLWWLLLADIADAAPLRTCEAPRVIDGDTIACGQLRIRLLGIDAPDHRKSAPCRRRVGDHVCDDGAADRATRLARLAVASHAVTFMPVGTDRYGRTVAQVFVGRADLQCFLIRYRAARYIPKYDARQLVARNCHVR